MRVPLVASLAWVMCALAFGCGGEEGGADEKTGPKTLVEPCDLLITEIMATPAPPVTGRRWVEIFNASAEDIDMRKVRLEVMKEGGKVPGKVEFTKRGGAVIPSGEFLWVRLGAEPVPAEETGDLNVYYADKNISIPAERFEISLKTGSNTVIHAVKFGPKSAPCVEASGVLTPPPVAKNQSMELLPFALNCWDSSNKCDSWVGATETLIPGDPGRGTPGRPPKTKTLGKEKKPAPGDLAVTEIMFRSSKENGEADWFELINLRDEDLSIRGCEMGDGTKTGAHVISDNVVIPAHGLALLSSKDLADIHEDYLFKNTNLNKSGDRLYLLCSAESGVMSSIFDVNFTSQGGFPIPVGAASIQVCPEKLPISPTAADYHNPANWSETTQSFVGKTSDLGSPGAPNPPCVGNCVPPDCGGECSKKCAPPLTCFKSGNEEICARTPVAGDLVVTEVMTNGSDECAGGADWVEIFSLSTDPLALAGCKLSDGVKEAVVPLGVFLNSGEYIVFIQTSKGEFEAPYSVFLGSYPNLDKDGDVLTMTCGSETIFSFGFGKKGDIPGPTDGTGTAGSVRVASQLGMYEGIPVTVDFADNPANWCEASAEMVCGDKGTPGQPNSPCGSPPAFCTPPCAPPSTCMNYKGNNVCVRKPVPGEIVPVEIMVNSSVACFNGKDWFEIMSLSNDVLNLKGCKLKDDSNSAYVIDSDLVLEPGSLALLVQDTTCAPERYCYGANPNLSAGNDSLSLSCDGAVVFAIAYGSPGGIKAPKTEKNAEGITISVASQLQLPAGVFSAQYALDPSNWTYACQTTECGDKGSPGAPNPPCPK